MADVCFSKGTMDDGTTLLTLIHVYHLLLLYVRGICGWIDGEKGDISNEARSGGQTDIHTSFLGRGGMR